MPITAAQATSDAKLPGGWQSIFGGLTQVSVGNADNIWGVNTTASKDEIWRYHHGDWRRVRGALTWIAAGADGTVWGVNRAGDVFRREGKEWIKKRGQLFQISCGDANRVVGVDGDEQPWYWAKGDFLKFPERRLVKIAIGTDDTVYGLDRNDGIHRWVNNKWQTFGAGRLRQVSVGSKNHVWGVDKDGNVYRTFENAKDWLSVPGKKLSNVSIGADGTVMGIAPDTSLVEWRSGGEAPAVLRQPVTLLSYNTHLFGGSNAEVARDGIAMYQETRGRNETDPIVFEDDRRASEIAMRIADFDADIVALMEVWAFQRQEDFAKLLKDWYPYSFHPGQGKFYKNTSGLLLLSKVPLYDVGFREFDNLTGEEAWSEKGVIVATVHLWQRYAFRIGITHLGGDMGGPAQPQVYQVQNETVFAKEPALMVGDFNVHRSVYSTMNQIMNNAGAADAWLAVKGNTMDNGNTIDLANNRLDQYFSPRVRPEDFGKEGHLDRLDYAYVKTSGKATTLTPIDMKVLTDWKYDSPKGGLGMDLSDHYPIFLTLEATLDTRPR